MAYTLEQRALAVAEYRLTGSYTHARKALGCSLNAVKDWAARADSQILDGEKELSDRADEIVALRRATLDDLIERTIELQLRDLPTADFRDRTGLLKIANEIRLLAAGKPTAITKSVDQMDTDIETMLLEMARREAEQERAEA